MSAQWEQAQQFNDPSHVITTHAIPLLGNYARRAILRHRGRDKPGTRVSVHSNLIIRHNEHTEATVSFVEMVLRYAGPEKAPRNWHRYKPTPAEQFTLFIFSTIEGEYLQAIQRVSLQNNQVDENLHRIYEILPGTSGSHYVATIHSHPNASMHKEKHTLSTSLIQ